MIVGVDSEKYKKLFARYCNLIHPKTGNADSSISNDVKVIEIRNTDSQLEIPFV